MGSLRTSDWIARIVALVVLPLFQGCSWAGLTWGALTYPTTQSGETANVVSDGTWAYATRGAAGLEILNLATQPPLRRFQPLPFGVESADDLALADGLLFVLDARAPGHLAVFSLADPGQPVLVDTPVAVDVGPFSGVSAAHGRVVVSGGTSRLSLRAYDAAGRLGADVVSADLGRGQPDVLLCPYGRYAFVSTHDWGPHFSLKIARLGETGALALESSLALRTYGFTPGGARPANFPIEAAFQDRLVYLASADGLRVIQLAPDAAPRLLAHLPLDVQPVNVDVRDGIAAVVGSAPAPALVFIDARKPSRPRVVQSVPLPAGSRGTGVALTDSHAVVAAHGLGTLLFARAKNAWELAHVPHHRPPEFKS
jgi:hypothetical protein